MAGALDPASRERCAHPGAHGHPSPPGGSLGRCSPPPTAGPPARSATGTGAGPVRPGSSCTAPVPAVPRSCCSTARSGPTTAAPGAPREVRCTPANPRTSGRCARCGRSSASARTTSSWGRSRSTTTAAGRTRPCWRGRLGRSSPPICAWTARAPRWPGCRWPRCPGSCQPRRDPADRSPGVRYRRGVLAGQLARPVTACRTGARSVPQVAPPAL